MSQRRSTRRSANAEPAAGVSRPSDETENLLLAALPRADRDRLIPTLEVVQLKLKVMLHKPGDAVPFVYFPGGGFCSIVAVLEDGSMVEVATIGREGAVGVISALDDSRSAEGAMVQGATDRCYRMPADVFRAEMDRRGSFYAVMTRYSNALVGFIMQSTACNAVHTIEKRLARWLLMAHDRMQSNAFPLTQEFVAMMLGATRPTVTVVAGTLQRAGLITYHRGVVTIVDRKRLERASCECYRTATNLLRAATVPVSAARSR